MAKHIIHRDIAEALGLHQSTISRALRNSHAVSKQVRKKVQAEARRLGYHPNPHASSLAEGRWHAHNREREVVCAFLTERNPANPIQKRRWEQLNEWAADWGYQMVLIQLKKDSNARAIYREMLAKGTRLALIDQSFQTRSQKIVNAPDFPWEAFSWVSVNEAVSRPKVHRVLFNEFGGMRDCLKHLYEYGYRRVAYVTSPIDNSSPVEKQEGAIHRFQSLYPDFNLLRVPLASFKHKRTQQVLAKKIDALLFSFFLAKEATLPVLESFPYASLALWPDFSKEVAGMELPEEDLFRSAFDLLDLQFRRGMNGIPTHRHTLMVDNYWRDGKSLPKIN